MFQGGFQRIITNSILSTDIETRQWNSEAEFVRVYDALYITCETTSRIVLVQDAAYTICPTRQMPQAMKNKVSGRLPGACVIVKPIHPNLRTDRDVISNTKIVEASVSAEEDRRCG